MDTGARAQTQFEAFLSMRQVTPDGLSSTDTHTQRCTVVCIHNAPEDFSTTIVRMWGHKSVLEAVEILKRPDVRVTNLSDKEVQLEKLLMLDTFAREHMLSHVSHAHAHVAAALPCEAPPSPLPAGAPGAEALRAEAHIA